MYPFGVGGELGRAGVAMETTRCMNEQEGWIIYHHRYITSVGTDAL